MPFSSKKGKRLLLTGALTVLALFVLYNQTKTTDVLGPLKPSDFHFENSNRAEENPLARQETGGEASLPRAPEKPAFRPDLSLLGPDASKWDIFEEILLSKNDNDPRIDKELRGFGAAMESALIEKYDSLEAEDRNGRGLVVFLLARDTKTDEGLQFLRKVYVESPCQSFEDCQTAQNQEPHHSGSDQVSLNYPQFAILFTLEKRLSENPDLLFDTQLKEEISKIIEEAEHFPVPAIQEKARQIRTKFKI